MNKYVVLFVLNIPFVLYGYVKTYIYWESKKSGRIGVFFRLLFWTALLIGLIFTNEIYEYLITHSITNSPPLSLADVVLATALNLTLFLVIRLYSRIDKLENKFTQLVTKLSVENEQLRKKR